jgi:phenylacetate-CoA ligase
VKQVSLAVPRSNVPGVEWPAIPAPVGASLLALQYQLEQTQWWRAEEIEAFQRLQLAELSRHAALTVPFYAGRLPAEPVDGDGWRSLPRVTRRDIQEAGDRLVSASPPPDHGRLITFQSSGSTGEPIRTRGTELTHFYNGALVLRESLWHRRDLGAKLASIRSKVEAAALPDWGAEFAAAYRTGPLALLNISTDVAAQLDWLLAEDPAYLLTHPSNALALLRLSLERGTRPRSLRELRTFGETLPAELRGLAREAWGVPVTDAYSSEELGTIALQCPEHEHYHVQAENLLVEVLDDRGNPCAPGQVGRVVATTLHNFAMPLIRYEIGDYAEVGEACRCGRGLPVLRRVLGRARNMLRLPDGGSHWPSFPSAEWLAVAPIRQIQLVQYSLEEVEVRYALTRELGAEEGARLAAVFQRCLGYPFRIRLTRVERIECNPGMKHEDFVSLVGR